MSQWTHIIGAIRLDGLPGIDPSYSVENVKSKLGKICRYDEWRDDCSLPMGSEGSLEYEVFEYGKGLPWVVITFWGDLRDYDNIAEVEQWWTKTLANFMLVRDGCLRISVEGGETKTLSTKER